MYVCESFVKIPSIALRLYIRHNNSVSYADRTMTQTYTNQY